jgi:hypothetical protein
MCFIIKPVVATGGSAPGRRTSNRRNLAAMKSRRHGEYLGSLHGELDADISPP